MALSCLYTVCPRSVIFYAFKINVSDRSSPEQLIQQLIAPALLQRNVQMSCQRATQHYIHYVLFFLSLLACVFFLSVHKTTCFRRCFLNQTALDWDTPAAAISAAELHQPAGLYRARPRAFICRADLLDQYLDQSLHIVMIAKACQNPFSVVRCSLLCSRWCSCQKTIHCVLFSAADQFVTDFTVEMHKIDKQHPVYFLMKCPRTASLSSKSTLGEKQLLCINISNV